MDLSYCRVSTTAQDLTWQIDAMRAAGVAEEHIYVDKRTGATMDRDGLTALLGFARPGDRINLLTLDRLGRNMRETLNLVHDLTQRGIFLRTLGDKLAVDTSDPGPGTDMAIALLAIFAQMERIYMLERAAGARAAGTPRSGPESAGSSSPTCSPIPAGPGYSSVGHFHHPGGEHPSYTGTPGRSGSRGRHRTSQKHTPDQVLRDLQQQIADARPGS